MNRIAFEQIKKRFNRRGQNMSVETLGKIVLLTLIAVAIIVFIVTGITQQGAVFNETGSSVVGGLTDKAANASHSLTLS